MFDLGLIQKSFDTASGIANSIASAINSSAPVNASVSNSSLSFTARTAGADGNTVLSAGCSYDSSNFTGASFHTWTSGSSLTEGKEPIYDPGSASISVNGHTNQVNFASGTTPASIATALAANINADIGAAVTATASNATVNLTATTKGTLSNYPMTVA